MTRKHRAKPVIPPARPPRRFQSFTVGERVLIAIERQRRQLASVVRVLDAGKFYVVRDRGGEQVISGQALQRAVA